MTANTARLLLSYDTGDIGGAIQAIFDSMFQGDEATTDHQAMVQAVQAIASSFSFAGRREDASAIRRAAKDAFGRAEAFAKRFAEGAAGADLRELHGGSGEGEQAKEGEEAKASRGFERLLPEDWRERDFVVDPEGALGEELERVQRWTKNVARYIALDVDAPTGILLVGPPGTGKTVAAHRIAARNGKKLIVGRHDAIQSHLLGQNLKNVRALIEAAAEEDAYIFLDEVDGIARDRKLAGPTDAHRIELLESLLEQLSILKRRRPEQVIFAATNLPEALDPAFVRRMAITLEFGYLSEPARRKLIEALYNNVDVDADALGVLIERSAEKSADYLRSIACAAARFAVDDLDESAVEALERIIAAKRAASEPAPAPSNGTAQVAPEGALALPVAPLPDLPRPRVVRKHVDEALRIIRDRHDKPAPRRTVGGAILLGT